MMQHVDEDSSEDRAVRLRWLVAVMNYCAASAEVDRINLEIEPCDPSAEDSYFQAMSELKSMQYEIYAELQASWGGIIGEFRNTFGSAEKVLNQEDSVAATLDLIKRCGEQRPRDWLAS